MTAAATVTAITPLEVDKLAREYLQLKDKLLEATLAAKAAAEPLDAKGEELKQLVGEFGSAHAEKSKLLHGLSYELMVTHGQSVSIDAAAVERFRLALVKAKCARLLKRLFEKTVRWTFSPEASVIVKGEKLSRPLLALFSQCEVIKLRAPSLTVREKST